MAGLALHACERAAHKSLLAGADEVGADGLLELEDEPGADRLDDGRGAALLARRPGRRGSGARPGRRTRPCRRPATFGTRLRDQLAAHDEDAGRLRPADELVRRRKTASLCRRAVRADSRMRIGT